LPCPGNRARPEKFQLYRIAGYKNRTETFTEKSSFGITALLLIVHGDDLNANPLICRWLSVDMIGTAGFSGRKFCPKYPLNLLTLGGKFRIVILLSDIREVGRNYD